MKSYTNVICIYGFTSLGPKITIDYKIFKYTSRSLPLNEMSTRGYDRTPTDRHRGFPGDREAREYRREREKDRDRDRDREFDFDGECLLS